MTYDINGIQSRSISRFFPLCARIFLLLLLLMLLPSLSLEAASLIYDQATGNLTGFDMNRSDSPSYALGYKGKIKPASNERYDHDGYIGRLLYVGGPTTFTFYKVGDKTGTGTGTTTNRFYFTHIDSCSNWREFFLVIRAKGLRHDGQHIDIYGENTVIQQNNETFTLSEGAGLELVASGENGYNATGGSGKYDGNNGYKYRYKYSYIWLDATIIHNYLVTVKYKVNGYFESHFGVSTNNGLNLIFDLQGFYGNTSQIPEPFLCRFEIEKHHTSPIYYSQIRRLNSLSNALPIASITYQSKNREALITISSDPAGSNTDFKFKSTSGESSLFNLAFKSTLPQENPVPIKSPDHSFRSTEQSKPSPIGDSSTSQVLEGEIQIYIDSNTVIPSAGHYSSTIYVLVAPTDGI